MSAEHPGTTSILLVEDDTLLRDLIRLVFSHQAGFDIAVAGDGVQALEMIQQNRPDVLLLDILLPKMNGLELLRHLKQEEMLKNLTVVVISALGYPEIIQQAVDAGASDFLVKPFDLDILVQRLGRALQRNNGTRISKLSADSASS